MILRRGVPRFLLKYRCLLIFLTILFTYLILFRSLTDLEDFPVRNEEFINEPIDVVYTWINGSDDKFLEDLNKYVIMNNSFAQDYSSQRFDDKYELKFSLRSLEKYAPWINHVYIVTNGQIPYWLNLDYEKVTLISHKDIFVDSYDLPTFSSPAIESHLHRIPGLSKRFIYFNDDVFLGAPVYVDDFFSFSRGFLIYLAWPLPMCAEDCSWVYVGDGQCDSACFNVACQMDGGDCDFSKKMKNPWDDNLSKLIYSNEFYSNFSKYKQLFKINYQTKPKNDTYQTNYTNMLITKDKKTNLTSFSNNTKQNLLTRLKSSIFHFHSNSTKNLTKAVEQHNRHVLYKNKIKRKKRKRHLKPNKVNIDIYGSSLQHTNRKYNLKYGFKSRYVPAHAPIMIDKEIMTDLQQVFSKEFEKTSQNRLRSEDDMQFSFSYYYFVISEKVNLTVGQIFDRFDTDSSGTWSDREIRTVLTKLYDLPLSYATVDHFEDILLNCSKTQVSRDTTTPEYERYIDSKLPTVTRGLVTNCLFLSTILHNQFNLISKYKYEVISNSQNSHAIFKMLTSNVSDVVGHLDEIRRHSKKFVCLNDNMDELKTEENDLIRAVLYDFYISIFPKPSRFELPTDFRNRFLYLDELNDWKSYHFKLKVCTYFCVFIMCYCLFCNLFKRRILYRFVNKLFC